MKPDLEVQDEQGFTALHVAVKSVHSVNSTRFVRALLLKGAQRSSKDKNGKKPINVIDAAVSKDLRSELKDILRSPTYCECCMVKFPMVPIKQNIKTVMLFTVLSAYIYFNLFFIIYPAMPQWYYALSSSMIGLKLFYCFIVLLMK
jgi:hypothetical protein